MGSVKTTADAANIVVKITKDHLADEDTTANVGSAEGLSFTKEEIVANLWGIENEREMKWAKESVEFRLLDDDGELYFEGWIIDDEEALTQQVLLKWAEKDSGCTQLLIKRGKSWYQEIG